jgi:DNA-binding response OmpR family regulator
MRVLLAEDDTDMLDLTTYALRKYGFAVTGVTDGATALERWKREQPDIVLLDVNLPGMSGLEICKEIRKQSSTPVIMVTALSDDDHVVEGFECGADDYVSKPLSYRTLATRMRCIAQRRTGSTMLAPTAGVESGDVRVDLEAHEVTKAGVPIRMTRLETRILYYLVSNAGHVLRTDRLVNLVWDYDGGDSFALKTHISHIRAKLGIERGQPGFICSLPQVGYKFETSRG